MVLKLFVFVEVLNLAVLSLQIQFDSLIFADSIWNLYFGFYPQFENALWKNQKARHKFISISRELKNYIE